MPGSVYGRDPHDLKELAPFASPYLTVVFPHPDWGDQAEDYTTDFHQLRRRTQRDFWRFEVRSSPDVEQVTLLWEGPPRIVRWLRLFDATAGRRVRMRPGGHYTFPAGGTTRVFSCRFPTPR